MKKKKTQMEEAREKLLNASDLAKEIRNLLPQVSAVLMHRVVPEFDVRDDPVHGNRMYVNMRIDCVITMDAAEIVRNTLLQHIALQKKYNQQEGKIQ